MSAEQREEAVFEAALKLPAGERAAFLDKTCAGDAELHRRVEVLLAAFERAGGFMNQPATPERTTGFSPPPLEKPGDKIGRYKLLEQIGEGGCGVVYVAEQQEPVRRRVALKVIKLGMDTKQVIARFEAERQALAMMDHPNIAKIFDAGVTDAPLTLALSPSDGEREKHPVGGSPLPSDVRGIRGEGNVGHPLPSDGRGVRGEGAAGHPLPSDGRGAGGEGSASLVTRHSSLITSAGRPYFVMELVRGIKITDYCDEHRLSPRERLELFIQVCRAIQHAHQKGIIHRDIKPSNILVTSDDGVPVPKVIDFGIAKATQGRLTDQTVYTAFEQFIGTPAYMSPEQAQLTMQDIDTRSDIYSLGVLLYELLTGKTPFDAKELLATGLDEMRRIIREVEPVKPSTRLTQEQSAGLAKSKIKNQKSKIENDLDWIVMKCLEKDRARRYETANGLATDITRHLNNEPIVARPPSRLYRFQKLVQRNKLAFGAATAVALALVIGFAVSTAMFFKAQAEKKKAQTESTKNQQTAQFLKDMLGGVSPWVALGRDTTLLRDILDKTAERVGNDFTNQPAVEAELRQTLGGVYFSLGSYEKAEAMQRQALAIRKKVFGNAHPDVASSLLGLGVALDYRGRRTEAEPLVREGLAMRRKFFGPDEQVAEALDILVKTLRNEGKLAEAETLAREHLALQKKRLGGEHSDVAASLYSLGRVLAYEKKWVEAEVTLREALAMQRKFLGHDHPEAGVTLGTLARVLRDQGQLTEAETMQREAVTTLRKALGSQHPYVGSALRELARILENQSRFAEAESLLHEVLASKSADVYIGLMDVLHKEGKRDEEEAVYLQAITEARKESGIVNDVEGLFDHLARRVERFGRQADAENLQREALDIRRKLLGSEHADVAASLDSLAKILLKDSLSVSNPDKQSKLAEAEQHAREALTMRRKLLGNDDPATLTSLQSLASILQQEGKLAEAEQVYRQALARVGDSVGKDPSTWAGLITSLADVLQLQNKTDAVEELFSHVLTPSVEQQPTSLRVVAARAEFFSRFGRWQQAVADAALLVRLEPTNHVHYHWLSSLLVQLGDVAGYRRNCQQALARFRGTAHPNVAERMAKDCLILAESGVDLVAMGAWADMALSRGKDSRDLPWFQFVKGLAEYRQGHFAEAQEWTEKVLNPSTESDNRNVEASAVLAMAQFKLNQIGAARLTLAKASQMEAQLPVARQDLGANWIDWIIAHALLREAKALIEGEAPSSATDEKKTEPR